jgi:hypothetical protein
MITLNDGTTTLTLHKDLLWVDEHQWHPIEQTAQRTVTGALILSVSDKVGGRPIPLQPEDDRSAWMTLATLNALRNWAAVKGKTMTLTLSGVAYPVVFRHHDGVAVEATKVVHYDDQQPGDWYRITLRLMET